MKNKKILIIVFGLLFSSFTLMAAIKIVPQPNNIKTGEGYFFLDSKTSVISGKNTTDEAELLCEILSNGFGEKIKMKSKGKGIILKLNPELEGQLGNEGYRFTSTNDNITIEGVTNTGVFYGIQTFRQLLPAGFEFNEFDKNSISIPVVEINDSPRFSWRAFLLDEARYFKGMGEVKKLLDQMAMLKMNVFHWHLTDDQGWRIEIKKYQKLTEVGAFRNDSQIGGWNSLKRSGVPHGGFYTQKQIKEIVEYATERHITIVPEIEMPGHATAAIAAYPWLGTLGTATEVSVVFGKMDDCFNVASPRVYQFFQDVLTEMFDLFPGKIIHIGGDEVKFDAWKKSKEVQAVMKKEGLNSPADLQIFFTNKISNFIDNHEYRMMGWNEILGGNIHEWQNAKDVEVTQKLASSAIIHFWKGNLDLIEDAVSNGYDIVNSYHVSTYLDYNYKSIPLKKAYSFNPIPEGLAEKYHSKVLGLGCQMWSEWIPTVTEMDMMIFPRIAAYAEVGWTQTSEKNFERFTEALVDVKKRWEFSNIGFTVEDE